MNNILKICLFFLERLQQRHKDLIVLMLRVRIPLWDVSVDPSDET
jgi:hypothetical protein